AYRSLPHSSHKFSPYEVMFGAPMRTPLDLDRGEPPRQEEMHKMYPFWVRRTMQDIHETVAHMSKKAAKRMKEYYDRTAKVTKNKGTTTKPKLEKALQIDHEEISLEEIFKEMIIKIEPVTEIEDPEETAETTSKAEVAKQCKTEESKTVVFFRLVDDFNVTDNESDEGERSEQSKQQEVSVRRLEAEGQETNTDEEEKEMDKRIAEEEARIREIEKQLVKIKEEKWKLIRIEEVAEAKGRREWLDRVTKRCRKCKKRGHVAKECL
ncbi:Dynein heavy chain-like protein, partial [Frankliniella fusca]